MKRVRETKARIACATRFNAGACEVALKLGAVDFDYPATERVLTIDTAVGRMRVWPATDPSSVLGGLHAGSFFTVFCRFVDADTDQLRAAAEVFGSNPCSGKHNFHFETGSEPDAVETALQAFERHVEQAVHWRPRAT